MIYFRESLTLDDFDEALNSIAYNTEGIFNGLVFWLLSKITKYLIKKSLNDLALLMRKRGFDLLRFLVLKGHVI